MQINIYNCSYHLIMLLINPLAHVCMYAHLIRDACMYVYVTFTKKIEFLTTS